MSDQWSTAKWGHAPQWCWISVWMLLLFFTPSGNSGNVTDTNPEAVGHPEPIPFEPRGLRLASNISQIAGNTTNQNPGGNTVPRASPEFFPDFDSAKAIWQQWWFAHIYGFGLIYVGLFILNAVGLMMVHHGVFRESALARCVLVCVIFLAATRIAILLVDPYGSRRLLDTTALNVLLGFSLPSLACAYGLLLAVLVNANKIGHKALILFRKRKLLYAVLLLLGIMYIVIEVIVLEYGVSSTILIVCQSMFIAWGFLTAGGFVLAGYKIVTALGAVGDAPNGARNGRGNNPRRTIITVTTISSALSAGYSVANIYVLVDTQTATNANANPWPWFICASSLRLLECIMSLSLWHIVTGGSGDRCTAMALFCCPIDKRKRSTNVHVDVGVKQIGYEKSEDAHKASQENNSLADKSMVKPSWDNIDPDASVMSKTLLRTDTLDEIQVNAAAGRDAMVADGASNSGQDKTSFQEMNDIPRIKPSLSKDSLHSWATNDLSDIRLQPVNHQSLTQGTPDSCNLTIKESCTIILSPTGSLVSPSHGSVACVPSAGPPVYIP